MDLKAWQQNWDELGKDDPLWLVVSDPSKKGGRWDPEEFFATGREEIRGVLADLDKLRLSVPRRRALDFGCGVGRLSQALAEQFDEVHGVDISPSLLENAKRFNRFPNKCTFHLNAENGLPMFESNYFDLVYSCITLQHIEPRFAKNYIREFARVARPGGAIVFQALRPVWWRALVPEAAVGVWRRFKHGGKPYIGMFAMSHRTITGALESAGARVVHVAPLWCENKRFLSFQYFATKGQRA